MMNNDDIQGEVELKLRNLRLDDYDNISEVMNRVYNNLGGVWPKENYAAMLKIFPEGQICVPF